MDDQSVTAIAAVVPVDPLDCDEIVSGFAIAQINLGRRIRGLVQEIGGKPGAKQVTLVDLDSGSLYPITQNLGKHSTSCRLKPEGIADATIVMRRIALRGAELAIFNRYSALEARGGGFAAEMLDLMERQIPVLTIVPQRHLETWRQFTGGLATELPPSRLALDNWFSGIRRANCSPRSTWRTPYWTPMPADHPCSSAWS